MIFIQAMLFDSSKYLRKLLIPCHLISRFVMTSNTDTAMANFCLQ